MTEPTRDEDETPKEDDAAPEESADELERGDGAPANEEADETVEADGASRKSFALAALGAVGIFASVFFVVNCHRPPETPTPLLAQRDQGERLYGTYCSLCHGDEGEGYAADNANALANQDFLVSVTDDFIRAGIHEGRPGTAMAAYASERGGPLSPDEVDALVTYIRAWQDEPSVDVHMRRVQGDATSGRALFAQHCASCHGPNAEGGNDYSAMSLENPHFLATASDGQIRYAIEKGRRGTPMPAFENELTPEHIDDVVVYLRSLQREVEVEEIVAPTAEELPVVINPDGEAPNFSELREGRYVPSEEVARELDRGAKMIILDARAASDFARFHIPGALPSPYYELDALKGRLPRDGTWILAYCGCPHAASGRVMDNLRDEGFENTAVIDEGIGHWRREGYPLAGSDVDGDNGDDAEKPGEPRAPGIVPAIRPGHEGHHHGHHHEHNHAH